MSPANNAHPANSSPPPPGMTLDDAVYTVFRHKWLILAFVALGIVGAVTVRVLRPPYFVSTAKVMVHYVVNDRELAPTSPDAPRAISTEVGAQSILSGQIEIIKSLDVAERVAEVVGPARLLANRGGGTNLMAAAGVVWGGTEVEQPKNSILTITFRNRNADIVQPVLEEVLKAYMQKHKSIYLMPDEFLIKQRDELGGKLAKTEEQIKDLKVKAKVLFPEQMKQSYEAQIRKTQDEFLDTQRELLERGAAGSGAAVPTNAVAASIPADELSRYSFWTTRLEELKMRENDLLVTYKVAHPVVQNVREQIESLSRQKAALDQKYPSLAHLLLGSPRTTTNAVPTEVLVARLQALSSILSNLQAQATQVMDLEPRISELERLRAEQQKSYDSVMKQLSQSERTESTVAGQINMSVVERPTPPGPDSKKMLKLIGGVLGGCIALGLGLAFLIDLFLDRSIKRSADIERHLRVPVFLSIPDTSSKGWLRPPSWLSFLGHGKPSAANGANGNGSGPSTTALAPWEPGNELRNYTEGLRERVMSYFEVQNLNLKKPKLVAVTGCSDGAGVSTLASGLAAALSKTGDGNVLLVDMNIEEGVAQSFYKGTPGCGITAALQPENRAEAQVEENLYLATLHNGNDSQLPKLLPTRLNHLMPRLKASDYDYIIFDMPPVTQTSATPRLASYMDLALLVLESEKTSQHAAARASTLMREARANVAAVLNKKRSHAPAALSHEA
jgi:polysaccharide biosynthesis transport protein